MRDLCLIPFHINVAFLQPPKILKNQTFSHVFRVCRKSVLELNRLNTEVCKNFLTFSFEKWWYSESLTKICSCTLHQSKVDIIVSWYLIVIILLLLLCFVVCETVLIYSMLWFCIFQPWTMFLIKWSIKSASDIFPESLVQCSIKLVWWHGCRKDCRMV